MKSKRMRMRKKKTRKGRKKGRMMRKKKKKRKGRKQGRMMMKRMMTMKIEWRRRIYYGILGRLQL